MATAKGGYFTKDGARVPSVTTVLGRYKECGGLMHWAWEVGKKGQDYRDERDKAASAGTMAHDAVEAWVKGNEYTFDGPEDVVANAKNAFQIFLRWTNQTQLRVTHTEVPLVSERYRFGGTLDGVTIHGKRAIIDWKTSNALYFEYVAQCAAYRLLWNENNPDDQVENEVNIVRFSKDHGDFEHRYFSVIDDAERYFLLLRDAYGISKLLEKRVR